MESKKYSMDLAGRELTLEFGKYCEQAAGSVWVHLGDTVVMVNATMAPTPRPGVDFFPLAVGVVVTSLTTGMTTDVDSFMFGSILAMDRADVALSVGLCAAVLVLYVLFYHRLFAITFDESFARATGVKVGLYNTILSVLTALTIVLGMRMMGAMLISSLVIFPALTAMTLLRSFRGVVICAAGLSVVCFCVGLTGSYLWGTPVGATVVLVNLAAFLLSRGVMKLKRAS